MSKKKKDELPESIPPAESAPVESIPEATASLAEVIQESTAALAEPLPETKSRRGRKPGGKNKAKEETAAVVPLGPSPFLPQIKTIVALPYSSAAENTGNEALRLNQGEVDALAESVDQCMQRYFPDLSNSYWGPLFALGFTAGMVTIPRYIEHQKFKRAKAVATETAVVENSTDAKIQSS